MQAPRSRRVLVVEDDREIAELVRLHLVDLGCEVQLASNGAAGLAQAQTEPFDLVILDIMLPGMDGLEVCKRLRAGANYLPILMTTSKSTELDRVLGLELGADDYLTKPFSVGELMARVKAIFRRVDAMAAAAMQPPPATLSAGELAIDRERRVVTLGGKPVDLTAKEFDLLACFAEHPGRVFNRAQLLDKVWGYSNIGYEHTVITHINRLRAKIEENPAKPRYILTVWSVGYKFAELGTGEAA
jgi:DNA-binding response OmpR family regulator